MYDSGSKTMIPMSDELAAKFADPNAELTEIEKIQRNWTRFHEGEVVHVKNVPMRVHEIGESRMVLKLK